MKKLLLAINAKYIHPNVALRLLKANTNYDVDIMEFTIKNHIDTIVDFIKEGNYKFVGFSCYIWNIEMIKQILPLLRNHDITILLGGPEVSYNAEYYINNNIADFVIKNEGEEAFDLLLKYLDNKISINEVPNLYHKDGFTFNKLVDISKIKLPYEYFPVDAKNIIAYIETSRGCPFHCGYCMASLDNKLRFFNIEEIKKNILYLQKRNYKIFKFLDRTFNANKKNFISLIDFIIMHHEDNTSFQFEITGDLLDDEIINYINEHAPKNLFRFEIGIQSTNELANKAVYRIQNNEKLFHNIRLIQDAKIIDLHLDLIAGLPYEDYASFIKTFNEVLSLRPKELQLGFLKLLKGTKLYEEKEKYGYIFNASAPYDIISNNFISKEDIEKIHIAEDAFEIYYNSSKYHNSINYVLNCINNPYELFFELGKYYPRKLQEKDRYNLFDNMIRNNINIDYQEFHKLLILDYLNVYPYKPSIWWENKVSQKEKANILRHFHQLNMLNHDLHILYNKSLVIKLEKNIIVSIYHQDKKEINIFENNICN